MPSITQTAVHKSITALIQQVHPYENISDILRVLKDEAALLYERQLVCDAFDLDPLEMGVRDDETLRLQINRAMDMLKVISFHRNATRDGYSSIEATVELKKDEKMSVDVKDHLCLTFRYDRFPLPRGSFLEEVDDEEICCDNGEAGEEEPTEVCSAEDNNESLKRPVESCEPCQESKKMKLSTETDYNNPSCCNPSGGARTHITYSIDLSRDFGKKEHLLLIEVVAPGEVPSRDDDDQWCIDVNDETLKNFLAWTNFDFDSGRSLLFFMTFPFYEREWDLDHFLLELGADGSDASANFDEE